MTELLYTSTYRLNFFRIILIMEISQKNKMNFTLSNSSSQVIHCFVIWAAITKYYSLGVLSNRHLFPTDLKAERSKICRMSSWWEEPRLAHHLLDVCLHGLSSVYAHVQTDTSCLFLFFKGSNPIMKVPPTWLHLNPVTF